MCQEPLLCFSPYLSSLFNLTHKQSKDYIAGDKIFEKDFFIKMFFW